MFTLVIAGSMHEARQKGCCAEDQDGCEPLRKGIFEEHARL